jgi:hypothetical protein
MTSSAIAAISTIFAANLALAQDITGNWAATPLNNNPLSRFKRIVVVLSKNRQNDLTGTMYVGYRQVLVYPCSSVSLIGSHLNLVMERQDMPRDVMVFHGIVSQDGNSIDGSLQSSGHDDPLQLKRSGRAHNAKAPPEKVEVPAPPPPELTTETAIVPSALTPVPTVESSALLARALEKLFGTNLRLLKYTCLETIERFYYSVPAQKMGTDVMTEPPQSACKQRESGKERRLILNAQDRLRMEVAVADNREIASWAAADRFDSRSIDDLVFTGATSTGEFGTTLVDIFENPGAQYTSLGKKTEGSRVVFEYAFDVPLSASRYFVKAGSVWREELHFMAGLTSIRRPPSWRG